MDCPGHPETNLVVLTVTEKRIVPFGWQPSTERTIEEYRGSFATNETVSALLGAIANSFEEEVGEKKRSFARKPPEKQFI